MDCDNEDSETVVPAVANIRNLNLLYNFIYSDEQDVHKKISDIYKKVLICLLKGYYIRASIFISQNKYCTVYNVLDCFIINETDLEILFFSNVFVPKNSRAVSFRIEVWDLKPTDQSYFRLRHCSLSYFEDQNYHFSYPQFSIIPNLLTKEQYLLNCN